MSWSLDAAYKRLLSSRGESDSPPSPRQPPSDSPPVTPRSGSWIGCDSDSTACSESDSSDEGIYWGGTVRIRRIRTLGYCVVSTVDGERITELEVDYWTDVRDVVDVIFRDTTTLTNGFQLFHGPRRLLPRRDAYVPLADLVSRDCHSRNYPESIVRWLHPVILRLTVIDTSKRPRVSLETAKGTVGTMTIPTVTAKGTTGHTV